MREKAGLLVGMDICEDYVQLTYYDQSVGGKEKSNTLYLQDWRTEKVKMTG